MSPKTKISTVSVIYVQALSLGRSGWLEIGRLVPGAVQEQQDARHGYQPAEDTEPHAPCLGLGGETGCGLNEERIGKQCDQASKIARPVKKVRVCRLRMVGAREPRLKQGRVCRDNKKGKADANDEQLEEPE